MSRLRAARVSSRRRGREAATADGAAPRHDTARPRGSTVADRVLADDAATLLDVVDHALTKGVVLTGDLMIGLARVDLIYARLSLLLCAADRVMPGEDPDPLRRRHDRRAARRRHAGG